jgi:hypothetical protein
VGAAAPADSSCPSRNFSAFLAVFAVFAEDGALQHRLTHYPLAYTTVEDGPVEPEMVERRVPADSVTRPLFLPAAKVAADGTDVRTDSTHADRRLVVLIKPETDDQ